MTDEASWGPLSACPGRWRSFAGPFTVTPYLADREFHRLSNRED